MAAFEWLMRQNELGGGSSLPDPYGEATPRYSIPARRGEAALRPTTPNLRERIYQMLMGSSTGQRGQGTAARAALSRGLAQAVPNMQQIKRGAQNLDIGEVSQGLGALPVPLRGVRGVQSRNFGGQFSPSLGYRNMAGKPMPALNAAAAGMAASAATKGMQGAAPAARPMTVRGANQWAGVNPEAGMDQMYAKEIAAANAAFNDPEAGMDQMYAAEIAQSLKKPATKKVAAPKMTKAQQKVFADAAKEYQSNSMPVLMQPQGPTKGGAAMRPQINWGTNQQGYDTMGDFGGNAADLLRADAMRKQMMEAGMGGLLG